MAQWVRAMQRRGVTDYQASLCRLWHPTNHHAAAGGSTMRHGPLYPERVLYPVRLPLPARRRAIERAVDAVVARMKPRSLCYCGKFCATHRKLLAMRQQQEGE